jgi:transcriptional regulator with XRE-family HTH domain
MNPILNIRRHVLKVTQGGLAEIASVSQSTVSKWEGGELEPSREELGRIREAAQARGIEWDDRWFFEVPKPTAPDVASQISDHVPGSNASTNAQQTHLVDVAEHTLRFFTETAANALGELGEARPHSGDVFAAVNTLTADRAIRNLEGINRSRLQELRVLSTEPAIARIVVAEESGQTKVYFISRGTPTRPPRDGSVVASYRSPAGRLAAVPVGSDFEFVTTRGVRSVEVLERSALRPKIVKDQWDSVDSTVEGTKFGPVTVTSFRQLLSSVVESERIDVLDAMLAEDRAAGSIIEGFRRNIIAKMELRDQPLLDQFQDGIFRLPLDTQLAIFGPPGTGKTTTLIKRLGLKLDPEYLSEEEREQVRATVAGSARHAQSWIMFTPTDLLRQYVKEAFARENVPASDSHIYTWADYRRELARHKFGILRTTAGTGSFVLKDDLPSLQATTLERQRQWFGDFDGWQAEGFWSDLQSHAKNLASNVDSAIAKIGARLDGIIGGGALDANASAFISISENVDELRALISRLKSDTDAKIRAAIARELGRDRTLLDQLSRFVATLGDAADDADDQDSDEEEEGNQTRIGREAAFEAYARAIRARARAAASGRNMNRQSRSGRIADWLGDRRIPTSELRALGSTLQVQSSLQRFANPLRRYFSGLPLRYRRFRRDRQAEGRWYRKDGFGPADINPLEVDIVLLAILRGMRSLLGDRRIARDFAQEKFLTLKAIQDLYKTQVAVDEATDFSPVQLACMAALCDPATESFVACGDFNQRITEWGSRSSADLNWVFSDFDIRSINITYRHSRQLNELARSIVLLSTPDAPEAQLPRYVDNEGVEPVLATNLSDLDTVAGWLASRIGEIERFTRILPSIAVLVNEEDEVVPVAEALNRMLASGNIRAVPCPRGNLAGHENDVRVFDIQHIKGLEFEAVFFVGVDRLAEQQPDLFDKYLYVGATRAAMYLGLVTGAKSLPSRIKSLQSRFVERWEPKITVRETEA